ncbi:alpha/beta fold hydrolase [Ruixingdingia sedimenti]|uniref:Alpha/beta hydrolase n=1 Tax=Ruixingdingia sedimenti TaxID=3073604 RepID=A0ABU1FCT0_9RHOB|nr:alpha/beta hydrolase [Xinfangfangia sp. LG-4]MDR5654197.1 alpha/beta hydrolase [Xinfangfangia sp. LG-4]
MFTAHISAGIDYRERPGSGPALVLLHGIGSNATSFAGLLPLLPADWRVLAWNAPGYGGSAPLGSDWPLAADYAGALAGWLDRLGLGRVVLAGHSLGALMAGAFALAHPGRVARLVLASPALGHGIAPGAPLPPAAQGRIDDLARLGPAAFARARAPALICGAAANPALVAAVETGMACVRNPGYAQAVRMLAAGRLVEDAARLAVPTEVVTGAEDAVTPPEGARRLHAAIPPAHRGPLIEVPATGHALYTQAPLAFAEVLARPATPDTGTGKKEQAT